MSTALPEIILTTLILYALQKWNLRLYQHHNEVQDYLYMDFLLSLSSKCDDCHRLIQLQELFNYTCLVNVQQTVEFLFRFRLEWYNTYARLKVNSSVEPEHCHSVMFVNLHTKFLTASVSLANSCCRVRASWSSTHHFPCIIFFRWPKAECVQSRPVR